MNKQDIIKLAAETAVQKTLETLDQERKKQIKSRHDQRLRNTRLLLRNYNMLKDHCEKSVYKLQQAAGAENAIDILDALNRCSGDVYIESIKNSVARTHVIITHIDEMLKMYKIYCDKSDKEEDKRRYRVLCAAYFKKQKVEDICQQENIDRRTYFRDTNDAIEKLSALIFGFDGLYDVSQTCH
ncbi:hypothetical protein SCACP_21510 [Sporomusa carbonis]|uniref:hypothetical protein n=1 Tax=Sporomusa carbonis TaxID=3076075 RepID=UPI003A5F52DA